MRGLAPDTLDQSQKVRAADFTRKRKLDPRNTFALTLAISCSGKAAGMAGVVSAFHSQARLLGTEGIAGQPCASSVVRARRKLGHAPFRDAFGKAVRKFQGISGILGKGVWHGMRVYAGDGSKIRLPATPEIRAAYDPDAGLAPGGHSGHYPQALLTMVSDASTGMPVALCIGPSKGSEPRQLEGLIDELNTLRRGILVLDRGYPGNALLRALNTRYHGFFMVRCPASGTFKAVGEFLAGRQEQAWVDLADGEGTMRLRAVRMRLGDGTENALLTNMMDEGVSARDFVELYHRRWAVETGFRDLKCGFNLEKFASRSVGGVLQEIWALALGVALANILRMVAAKKGDEAQLKNAVLAMGFGAIALAGRCNAATRACLAELLERIERVRYRPAPPFTRSYPRLSKAPINKWTSGNRSAGEP